MKKADIGLIGLAVMGENLVLNMESKGFTVAVFNRTTEKVKNFVEGRGAGKNIIGSYSLEELVAIVEKPRKIMMMIKAGSAVDATIDALLPLLDDGDIIIDGGNSHFPDTVRRTCPRLCVKRLPPPWSKFRDPEKRFFYMTPSAALRPFRSKPLCL